MRAIQAALALGFASWLGVTGHAASQPVGARLSSGSGSFVYRFASAGETREIKVWYHRPETAAADATLVFVLHGEYRNAQTYRKYWIPLAEERHFVLLVPEFSRQQFPGSASYNEGNIFDAGGARRPEAQWSFTAVENIFDAVRIANGFSASTYDIYGHSAGGQFVHRMVLFKPDARYRVAVVANPGRFMMPDFEIAYPHGLKGSGIDRKQAARAFGRPLIVLLGDQDVDPNHRQSSRTPEAMAQGEHRYARGHAFYELARRAAGELGAPFAWSLKIAPGVGHSNARIAPYAASAMAAAN